MRQSYPEMMRLIAASLAFIAATAAAAELTVVEQGYLARDFVFIESPGIQDYLRSIAEKLLQTRQEKAPVPQLILHSAGEFSAMADDDDAIVLSTETLRLLQSEDELAALLSHELAHVVLRHVHKKSLIARLPLTVESMGELAAIGDQVKEDAQTPATQVQTTGFAKDSLKTTQRVSLFWTDVLAPNWNRDQEREADRAGFTMMHDAGYDPQAFATLFQKLKDAQLKRSERVETLRQSLIRRAQAEKKSTSTAMTPFELAVRRAGQEVKHGLSEKGINAVFDTLAKETKEYDSPEQRQALLEAFASESQALIQDKKLRSPRFGQILQEGPGGALLQADATALRAVQAMEAGQHATAAKAVAELMPKPSGKSGAKKGTRAKGKKGVTLSVPADSNPVTELASPHLAFAIGKWLVEQQKLKEAEGYARTWAAYPRAPARAFLWLASHRATGGELAEANSILDSARQQLADGAPFLPQMITYARMGADKESAEALTSECETEGQARQIRVTRVLSSLKGTASGLYAKCLHALGYVPEGKPGGVVDSFRSIFKPSTEKTDQAKEEALK